MYKMTERELLRLELVEALRSLGEIVMEEEPNDEELSEEDDDWCAYCRKEIDKDSEYFDVVLVVEGYDSKDTNGKRILVCLEEARRSFPATVIIECSEAKKNCIKLGFETCSEGCTGNLKATLQKEIDFGRITLKAAM